MGGKFFSSGGSKSRSYQASREGLAYLDTARQSLQNQGASIIADTLQKRLENISAMMGNMASIAQMQGRINAIGGIPGATNTAGVQALLSVMPTVTQMQDQMYAQSGEQQLALQDMLSKLAAQYAGLTGYSHSKTTSPGIGGNLLQAGLGGFGMMLGAKLANKI